ncbi:MAG: hypothetical protein IPJ69_03145 [Deltaproteobacteria bacterium]|nr:MAG: hypothetical protein IPJ69_03145 [Deltaproteobacteria bacterium]
MYQRVFNANNPYLGFSSVLNIPELEGLKELECASSEDFNSKIEKIHDLSKSENYVKSKNYLAKILNSCIDQFNSHINHPKREPLLFETLTEQYNATFRELTLPHYMETNQKKVEECFQRFITLNDQPIGFERSLFSNRPYFDKILNAYQKLYPEEAIF